MAMNFFAQQERARSHTKRMLILFVLAVVCIVGAIDIVLFLAFGASDEHHTANLGAMAPRVMFLTSLGVLAFIGVCSLYKIGTLRSGGAAVAEQLGATRIEPTSAGLRAQALAQRRRGNGDRLRRTRSGNLHPRRRTGDQRLRRRLHAVRRRRHRHARRDRQTHARRTAGRDRARVLARSQRRHAPEHPPDGRAVRHPRHRHRGTQDAARAPDAAAIPAGMSRSASPSSPSATSACFSDV